MKLYIFNGPNLNLLGLREPEIYGTASLEDVKNAIRNELNLAEHLTNKNVELEFKQTNSESELINWLHDIFQNHNSEQIGIIINPGAFTHYSYSLTDALVVFKGLENVKVIELHLSNPSSREQFRKNSVISPNVDSIIAGFGILGYILAIKSFFE